MNTCNAYRKRENTRGPRGPDGPKQRSLIRSTAYSDDVPGAAMDQVHVSPRTSLFVSTSLDTWTTGQPIIFTRGVQIDDTSYLALIPKLRVAPLAYGLGETRRLRGDGSARSQQIRLGSALSSCRDRSFNGLRIVRADRGTKHKGVTMYALAPADGAANWGCWGCFGDVADKHPQEVNDSESTAYKPFGDVGDVEGVPPRVERDFCANAAEDACEDTRAHACIEDGGNIPNIPNIPKMSVSHCEESTNGLGMLEGNIPKTSPNAPHIPKSPTRRRIDLADFTEWPEPPDGRQS